MRSIIPAPPAVCLYFVAHLLQGGASVHLSVVARVLPVCVDALFQRSLEMQHMGGFAAAAPQLLALSVLPILLPRPVENVARQQHDVEQDLLLWILEGETQRNVLLQLARGRVLPLVAVVFIHELRQRHLVRHPEPAPQHRLLAERDVEHVLEELHPLVGVLLLDEQDAAVDGHLLVLTPGGGHVVVVEEDVVQRARDQHVRVKEHQVVRRPLAELLSQEAGPGLHARNHPLLHIQALVAHQLHLGPGDARVDGVGELGVHVGEDDQAAVGMSHPRRLEQQVDHLAHLFGLAIEGEPFRGALGLAILDVRLRNLWGLSAPHNERDGGPLETCRVRRKVLVNGLVHSGHHAWGTSLTAAPLLSEDGSGTAGLSAILTLNKCMPATLATAHVSTLLRAAYDTTGNIP
mmetsp:Transcript_34576/g.75568  ORF Transcript_34576/g.75568 Transcript_34576/m.75568 type:complete len:405 (-) Transcript_34576:607-1821(-)